MKPTNYPQNPEALWNVFFDFTQTPRPSRAEEKISEYLIKLAGDHNLKHQVDAAGNIIIYVPGKGGRENDEPVLIQNHIDMVTDALPDREINFKTDPIETYVDGEWLKARGTTLGADNGIGCAAALATIFDKTMVHPPLELLFTVDEETGLNGALGLEHKYLTAKKMLNLDTEEWGSVYIGCAGGIDYEVSGEMHVVAASKKEFYKLQVEGFVGGHSGLDIHEQRGNAIKFLGEILSKVQNEIEIAEIRGGKAHNIIPRDAFALIACDSGMAEKIKFTADQVLKKWMSFLPEEDKAAKISLTSIDAMESVLSKESKQNLLKLITLFPHGAHAFDSLEEKLVSMSNNMARLLVVAGKLYIQSSLRFFDREEVRSIEDQIRTLGEIFNLKVECHSEYPSWKPNRDNPLLDQVKDVYKELYGEFPEVKAIHAGLECGILRDKIGEIDVVSFGPTIMGAHSPDERVYIPSVEKFWDLFKAVMAKI